MEWTRSDTSALAIDSCTQCHGLGLRLGKKERMNPCNCVLRAIFRACHARFRHCATKEKYMSRISLELVSGRERSFSWGRKDEEYMADFILLSRRTLSEFDYKVFRFHFLLGADWKLCCRRMGIDRGTFFHAVYRVQQELGRVFREVEPYSLFPLDEYFHGSVHAVPVRACQPPSVPRMPPGVWSQNLRPGLLKSA
jgi:hypothetical protein